MIFNPNYKKIVIGSDVSALAYAYINNIPLIFNSHKEPKFFEEFEPDVDLSLFNVSSNLKLNLWKRLCFSMSLAGQIPLPKPATSMRVEDNILKVFISNSKMVKFEFSELIVFDDENVGGLGTGMQEDRYKVYDWINVRSAGKHDVEHLVMFDDFVSEVYFYPSNRVDGNHGDKKDVVAISCLTSEQLNDISYSDTYVRFKVKRIMEEQGIKGKRNGKNPSYPKKSKEVYRYLSIKLESDRREVITVKKGQPLEPIENVTFIEKPFKEISEMEIDLDNNLAHTINWKL